MKFGLSGTCSGIGNRIKCIVGLILEHNPDIVLCHWPQHLDGHMIDAERAQIEKFSRCFKCTQIIASDGYDIIEYAKAHNSVMRYTWKWHDQVALDYQFAKTPELWKQRIYNVLTTYFPLSNCVQKIVDERWQQVQKCDVGVFIRTGDTQKQEYAAKFNKIEDFPIDPNQKYFVVGDAPRVWRHFSQLNNVVCFLEDNYIYGGWPSHIANAILLSRLPKFIASVSTFSEIVYAFGGFKQEIVVIPVHPTRAYGSHGKDMVDFQINNLKQRAINSTSP